MSQLKFGSAGVTAQEIDVSSPQAQEPVGIPAGIIGTATKGPAYVPVTVGIIDDFYAKFGKTDGKKFGPLAASEWMRNASALTYLRVLGVGDGKKRAEDGSVNSAGFTVGEQQPRASDGILSPNPYANGGNLSVLGRTYFLGAFMSESAGSSLFSAAGLQGVSLGVNTAAPIVRGILMAPSGVIMRLSSSAEGTSAPPASTLVATDGTANGTLVGAVTLLNNGVAKQDFVLLLNGHKGTDALYPNVITASFDMTAPNYFGNVLNRDPFKYQQAGHYLHAHWDVHPATAVVTGSGLVSPLSGAGVNAGVEASAFLTTASLGRNVGSDVVPNYEGWSDRFSHARSPWVISQRFGGEATELFRLHALDAGAGVSTMFKLSIENIAPSSDPANRYGTFDIIVRDWNDNDTNVLPIEQWRGLSLDPNSDRFIARIIGDVHAFYDFDHTEAGQKLVIDGNYPNKSNLIRVEVSSDVDNLAADPTALPFGVRGPLHLVTSGSAPLTSPSSTQLVATDILKRATEMPLPLRSDLTQGTGTKASANPQLYWGVRFEHVTSLATPNASSLRNASLTAFAAAFPGFSTTQQAVVVGDNAGTPDTAADGILDADRFCRNVFSLENVRVVTGSNGTADPNSWVSAAYVRDGNITPNDAAKTRAVVATDFTQANRRFLKFSFIVQGGQDGVNIFDSDESQINDNAVVADMNDAARGRSNGPNVKSYTKALTVMANVVNADVQLLANPGIRHPIVTNTGIDAVTERFDALYIMDIEQVDGNGDNVVADSQLPAVQATADQLSGRTLDSSFAAAFFPDVVITDPNTGTNVVVPPSVAVLGAIALNDAVGHPWFAPAGFTRGALQTVLEPRVALSKGNMDALYDVNVNPLVAFPGNATVGTNPRGGVVVWGQKTLQAAASALDRVNVRRLLIDIRRQVRDIAQTIVFEPNRDSTLAKFSAAVTPRLQRIQQLSGLEKYRVVIDSSTTTQADVENNTIRGRIIVMPTKTVEFVAIDFVVNNRI
jgi:phage tail sheath protein FI